MTKNTNTCFIAINDDDNVEVLFNNNVMLATLDTYGFCIAHEATSNKKYILSKSPLSEDIDVSSVSLH